MPISPPKAYIIESGQYDETRDHGVCLTKERADEVLRESQTYAEGVLSRLNRTHSFPKSRFDPDTGEERKAWRETEAGRFMECTKEDWPHGIFWNLTDKVLPMHPAIVREIAVL